MDNPITSNKILALIENQWLSSTDIAYKLDLKHSLDRKYLGLKLKELNRKEKIIYEYDNENGLIYWRCNNLSSYMSRITFHLMLLEEYPFDAELWYNLGDLYFELEYFESEEKGLSVEIVRQIKGYHKNALRLVDQVLNFKLYCDILVNLLMVYIVLGEVDKALSRIDPLLEIQEEFEGDFLSVIYQILTEIFITKKEYNQALEYAEKAKKSSPENLNIDGVFSRIRNLQDSSPDEQEGIIEKAEISQNTNNLYTEKTPVSYEYLIFRELEKSNIILMRTYINQSLKPFLNKPTKRQFKKLKSMVDSYKDGWPVDLWESFVKDYHRVLEQCKKMQPSKWKRWGNVLMKLVTII